MPDLEAEILAAAAAPASASVDGTSVSQQPLSALIEADKYLKQVEAQTRKGRGLRFTRLVAPGTIYDS